MEFVQPQPFDEAVAKLGARSPVASTLNSAQWSEVPVALRERTFFSSEVESVRFLQRAKDTLSEYLAGARDPATGALKTGSRAAFVQQMQRFALAEGMGPLKTVDKGTIKDITTEGRLGLIFDVQTKAARDFGNWKQGMDPALLDEFPAQRFIRVRKVRKPRPYHQAALGEVRLKTDLAFWLGLNRDFGVPWGPWGFNSGCDVEDVDRREAERLGLLKPGERVRPVDKDFNEGLQASVAGLDPGLLGALRQSLGERAVLDGDILRWRRAPNPSAMEPDAEPRPAPAPQPAPVPTSPPVRPQEDRSILDAVRMEIADPGLAARVTETFDAIAQVHSVGKLEPLPVRELPPESSDHGAYDADTGVMSINPLSQESRLTTAHETFHALLDRVFAPFAELKTPSQARGRFDGAMRAWYDTLDQSAPAADLRFSISQNRRAVFAKYYKYLLRPEELMCRSYAQYIAVRSGQPDMLDELDARRRQTPNRYWTDDAFAPIMEALDAVLAERGWR